MTFDGSQRGLRNPSAAREHRGEDHIRCCGGELSIDQLNLVTHKDKCLCDSQLSDPPEVSHPVEDKIIGVCVFVCMCVHDCFLFISHLLQCFAEKTKCFESLETQSI